MNAVEIAEAVSDLAERPFDAAEFPFAFLEAFGNKETTIKKLRAGATSKSDVIGVLQINNVHIAVCSIGAASKKLAELKASPSTTTAVPVVLIRPSALLPLSCSGGFSFFPPRGDSMAAAPGRSAIGASLIRPKPTPPHPSAPRCG